MKIKMLLIGVISFAAVSLTGCSSSTKEVVTGTIEKHYGTDRGRYSYVLISYDGYYDRDGSNVAWDMKDGSKVKMIKTTHKNAAGGVKYVRLELATYGGI